MCKCNDVAIGSYDNQVMLRPPVAMQIATEKVHISIDACIADEIQSLWNVGIITTGCCCGHNINKPYIGVIDEHIPRMKELGYVVRYNECRPFNEDSFIPKFN